MRNVYEIWSRDGGSLILIACVYCCWMYVAIFDLQYDIGPAGGGWSKGSYTISVGTKQ